MCETPADSAGGSLAGLRPDRLENGDGHRLAVTGVDGFLEVARKVALEPEVRRTAAGFVGYGSTRRGDRVLLAVDTEHHPLITDSIARALREKGATVDVIQVDAGADREFDELDDPEVRELAARHGDPEQVLSEDWIPDLPGVSAGGRYEDYAKDPAAWIYRAMGVI